MDNRDDDYLDEKSGVMEPDDVSRAKSIYSIKRFAASLMQQHDYREEVESFQGTMAEFPHVLRAWRCLIEFGVATEESASFGPGRRRRSEREVIAGAITNAQTQSAAARRFDAVEETMSFNEALETVYEEYNQAKKELEDARSDDAGRRAVAEAEVKWEAEDYPGALTVLRAAADSANAYEKYCDYSAQYTTIALGAAREAKSNRDFDGAERILVSACGLVVDDSQLRKELDALQHRSSKKLSEMTAGDSFRFESVDGVQKDTAGNSYAPDNTFLLGATSKSSHGFASFYLGGEYSTMGGVIAVSDTSSKDEQKPYVARVEVRGKTKSGSESVLWSSDQLTRTTAPVVLPDVDISGVEWLEVRAYWDDGRSTNTGLTIILNGFELFNAS